MKNEWVWLEKYYNETGHEQSRIYIELTEINTLSYSANSVVQDNRKKGLETDFVLNFTKTSKKVPKLQELSEEDETKEILLLVDNYKKQNKDKKKDFFEIIIDIEVRDANHLQNIIAALRMEKEVSSLERLKG